MKKIFVTGIGTDVGKTFVSAILVEALKADYWKPIQTGNFFSTDTSVIKKLINNTDSQFHPESYCLKQFMSPHAAAELEGIEISLDAIQLPKTDNTLIVEGAGGLMVPLNKKEFVIDIITKFDFEVILVIQNYLGSINHSLLSIDALKNRGIKILGIIYNGPRHQLSYDIITEYSNLKVLGHINRETEVNQAIVSRYAKEYEYLKNT
jgi:dethiobiotin synthetase